MTGRCLILLGVLIFCTPAPLHAEAPRKIIIDGKFDDWKDVPVYKDPPNNTHDTDHNKKDDKPDPVDHADADLLEYRFTHDAENLYAYFKSRGAIGRTQSSANGKKPGRFYAILAIDVDNDEKTGYWLHEGGFYPTSTGYDLNAEIEFYDNRINTGHYINHACLDPKELDRAFLDQSSGQYKKDRAGPYKPGHVRIGPGTYRHYTEWVYHANDTITFVRDQGPQTLGIIEGALSADGHELEMIVPVKGFLVDSKSEPILKLGRKINISFSLEASGELAKGGKWASNTAEPIRGYVLDQPVADEKRRTGSLSGVVIEKGNSKDGKNGWVEIKADGEEKGRRYWPAADRKVGGPDREILALIRKVEIGSRVRMEWIDAGDGKDITKFEVLGPKKKG